MREKLLNRASGHSFHNASSFTFERLKADHSGSALEANLKAYINGFSANVRDIFIKRFEVLTRQPTWNDRSPSYNSPYENSFSGSRNGYGAGRNRW